MRKTFPLTLNSILFLAGIGSLFTRHLIPCAICFLLDSLLFIWIFRTERLPRLPDPGEELEALRADLSHRIEELTADNQLLTSENEQLLAALDQCRHRQAQVHYAGILYDCPLTSALPVCLDTFFKKYLNSHLSPPERERLRPDYSCAAPDAVTYLSESALMLICGNIFDNLSKFSPLTESVYIRITSTEEDSLIIFKNEGKGPAESELERLFDLNYQGINKKTGCGLGLTQVKALLDDYGGHIWAKSVNGSGFALYIQLPEQPSNADREESGNGGLK